MIKITGDKNELLALELLINAGHQNLDESVKRFFNNRKLPKRFVVEYADNDETWSVLYDNYI